MSPFANGCSSGRLITGCRDTAAEALAFIGWSNAGAKAAMLEAVANAGLLQAAVRLSGSRHALAYQVMACLHCFLQPAVGLSLRIFLGQTQLLDTSFGTFDAISFCSRCPQPYLTILCRPTMQASGLSDTSKPGSTSSSPPSLTLAHQGRSCSLCGCGA